MCILEFKCLFISVVLQNILLSTQIYVNKYIRHGPLLKNQKNGQKIRRFNNFDYNFNDWEDNSQNILLDYNLEATLKDDGNILHNYDVPTWNPAKTSNGVQAITTPRLYVTVTSNASNSVTTTEVETTLNAPTVTIETTKQVTTLETTLNEITGVSKPSNEATTVETTLDESVTGVESTTAKSAKAGININETQFPSEATSNTTQASPLTVETTEVTKPITSSISPTLTIETTQSETEAMTFPTTRATEPELNTFQHMMPTDLSMHYPSDMTFPGFNEPSTEPDPVSMMFTRQPTTISTTEGAMVQEAHHEMQEKQAGYLTAFLLEVSKIMATKNKADAATLFRALEGEVNSLEEKRQLTGFGKSTVAAFLTLVRTMNGVPTDVIQSQAALANYLLTNRRVTLSAEVLALLDFVDKIYLKQEGERILAVLQEINDFPNTTKSSEDIAAEMLSAAVMTPFKRIYSTPQEKYLVQRLDEIIVSKYLNGVAIQRRKGTPVFIKYVKTKRIRTPPTPLIQTKSTKRTTISNKYAKFSKNKTIKIAFHKRLRKYKDRRDPKHWHDWRHRRTTTTEVPTKPPRVTRNKKSIYVIKRYVKKNLKKRKFKPIPNPNDTTQYRLIDNKEIRKETELMILITKSIKKATTPKIIKETRNNKRKTDFAKSKINKAITHPLKKDKTGFKIRRFEVAKHIKEESSSTNKEEVLKANLYDALFHSNEAIFRDGKRFQENLKVINKQEISSYSDEETVLKSKIYKAFGYENDFAETVKRRRLN